MNAMAAADADRVLVFESAALDGGQQAVNVIDQQVGSPCQLDVETGIEHIRRGHALVHKAGFGTDDLGEVGEKGNDVMLGHRLDLVDARHIEHRITALFPDHGCGLLRHDTQFGKRISGMRFDLKPDSKARLGLPDGGHLRAAIAGDHCRAFQVSGFRLTNPRRSRESRSQSLNTKGTATKRWSAPSNPRE